MKNSHFQLFFLYNYSTQCLPDASQTNLYVEQELVYCKYFPITFSSTEAFEYEGLFFPSSSWMNNHMHTHAAGNKANIWPRNIKIPCQLSGQLPPKRAHNQRFVPAKPAVCARICHIQRTWGSPHLHAVLAEGGSVGSTISPSRRQQQLAEQMQL